MDMEMEIDTKSFISPLGQWLIPLETQARPSEIAILSENWALTASSQPEIKLVAGNWGVVVSDVIHDTHEPTPRVALINGSVIVLAVP